MADRKKALVVDDADENRKLIKSFLYFLGFDAETAVDGLSGKKALDTGHYDLLMSDIEMPNMNGFELLSWTRKNAKTAKLPIIMLSTLDSPEVIERCKRLGATAYIVKPFTKEKMESALVASGLTATGSSVGGPMRA